MASFPNAPDQLDATWLSAALGYPVEDFKVSHFSEGAGVVGLVTRVHLRAAEGPPSIIAKFPSPAAENRAVAHTYDMYGREVRFYQQTAKTIGLRTPACYYADFDADTQDFVLLIEDLQGYRIGDQVAGCSRDEALAVVNAVADLHSSLWDAPPPGMLSHNNPMQRDGMIAGFQVGWPVVTEHFGDLFSPRARAAGAKMPDKVAGLLEEMCRPPVCLSHADVRLDNIFFGHDEVVLVDCSRSALPRRSRTWPTSSPKAFRWRSAPPRTGRPAIKPHWRKGAWTTASNAVGSGSAPPPCTCCVMP